MAVAAGVPDRTRSRKLTQRCSILGRDVVAKAADLYVVDAVLDGGEKVAAQQRLVLEPERVLWLQRVIPVQQCQLTSGRRASCFAADCSACACA